MTKNEMRISLKETRLGLRNSTTRIPFRYGKACLTRCPQAVLQATIEVEGKLVRGWSGDCLPPSWFDKSPNRTYQQQIDDMLAIIKVAEKTFLEEFDGPTHFFAGWLIAYERVQSRAAEWQLTPLLASFGISMLERAVMDAMARAAGMSFFQAVKHNLYAIDPCELHEELPRGTSLADSLPARPVERVFVRHTVGLGDPLTAAEIDPAERLTDGYPQSLEEYIQQTGLRYFKIKVSNQLDHDLQRLQQIAELVERQRGDDYRVTLDGNEQYRSAADFARLVEALQGTESLKSLWANTLVIEQPLERRLALDEEHTGGIRDLAAQRAVIIDESDGTLHSYREAAKVGYRGVSSKNCKGPIKSLLNACLTWYWNERGQTGNYLMTGEDLCTVGVIPVQSDLCLTSALGLDHVERNGHHYHPGLSYLPLQQRERALAAHDDFYSQHNDVIAPRLVDGQFSIGSLQCKGFGFAVEPDFESMQSPDEWQFASLGLDSSGN